MQCEFPLRLNQPRLPVLAVITRCIHQQNAVRLTYHSLNHGPSEREVVPFALIDSGLRWMFEFTIADHVNFEIWSLRA